MKLVSVDVEITYLEKPVLIYKSADNDLFLFKIGTKDGEPVVIHSDKKELKTIPQNEHLPTLEQYMKFSCNVEWKAIKKEIAE